MLKKSSLSQFCWLQRLTVSGHFSLCLSMVGEQKWSEVGGLNISQHESTLFYCVNCNSYLYCFYLYNGDNISQTPISSVEWEILTSAISRNYVKMKDSQNAKYGTAIKANTPVYIWWFISKHAVNKTDTDCIFNKVGRKFSINSGNPVFQWSESFFEGLLYWISFEFVPVFKISKVKKWGHIRFFWQIYSFLKGKTKHFYHLIITYFYTKQFKLIQCYCLAFLKT